MQRPWNSLRRFLRFPTRPRTIVRHRSRMRPNLEYLEDRTVPTVVFNSALGGDTIQWMSGGVVTSPVSNSTALQNPTVYFIFQGTSWNSTNAGALAADAQTIIQSKYLSKLTDYGSTGTAVYGGYTIDNTAAPTPDPNPNNQQGQFINAAQTEIQKIVPNMSSWAKPKDQNAVDSPIYIVVDDTGFTDSNGNHKGGEGWNGSKSYTSNLTMNEIFIADWFGDQDGFTDTFSHEIVERIFTGSGTGLTMNASADASTDGEFQNAQIGDNEPDQANYTYRLNGSLQVQAYWSLSTPNTNGLNGGFGAFVVPDSNQEYFYLDPQWNFVKNETINGQTYPVYSYTKQNQLLIVGSNQGNTITLGTTGNGGVQVTLNGETESFDPFFEPGLSITEVIVQPGSGSSAVNVLATPSGIPTYIEDQGNDSVVVGNIFGNVNNGAGYVGNIHGLVAVAANGDIGEPGATHLFLDDSGDRVGQTVAMYDGQIDYGGAAPIYYNPSAASTGDVTYLAVYGGSGGNTFNVNNTSNLHDGTYLATGNGNDTVNVSATQGTLYDDNTGGNDITRLGLGNTSNLKGFVWASAEGATSLTINDSSDTTGRTVTMGDGTLSGLGSGGIFWTPASSSTGGVTSVEVDGGTGANTFDIEGTALGVPVTLNGAGSSNSLTVDDQNATAAEHYAITPTSIARSGSAGISYSDIQSVTVNGGNHGNSFSVPSTAAGTSLTVNAGSGNDTVTVGNSTDGLGDINWESSLAVNGVAGHTTLVLNDRAGSAGGLLVSRTYANQGFRQIFYANISNLIVDAQSAGSYEVDVVYTPAGMKTTVNAGAGGDLVHLGGTLTGIANDVLGPVTINGAGNTQCIVYDQTNSTAQTYTVTANAFARSGFSLTYSKLDNLTINGGSANEVYDIASTAAGAPVIINAGSGNNGFNLGSGNSLNSIHGAVSVNGGSGSNTLNANDSSSATGQSYTLSSTHLTRSGIAAVSYASLAAIHVTASGNDTLTLLTPVPTVATTFNGGTGTNTLKGANVSNSWTISGANSGKLDSVSFSNFQKLVGGSGVDVFNFSSPNGNVLSINGGAAPAHRGNWLNYAAFPSTSTVTVNLATGSASNVNSGAAGAVSNIQNAIGSSSGTNNLTGSSQGNILIGGSGANTLTGGSGSSLLIGGSGHGSLTGGAGSDILIAGTTADNATTTTGQNALMAILAELQSADTFALKVSDIINGNKNAGGSDLNGSNKLTWGVSGATVTASTGAFALAGDTTASSTADWFFANASSTVKDFNDDSVKDEHNNNALGVF